MKSTTIITILLTLATSVWSQKKESVLTQGNWYKFSVNKTGVFKINTLFFKKLGINPNNIDPKNIKIYGNGGQMLPEKISETTFTTLQENAIYVKGENDNTFDDDDYILFYAKGTDKWNVNKSIPTAYHQQNIYDDKAYYFLTIGDGLGKRISTALDVAGTTTKTITTYDDYIFHEKEDTNLLALGRYWFGEDFSIENRKNITIPFDNAVQDYPLTVRVAAVTQSTSTSSLHISINGKKTETLHFSSSSGSGSSGRASYIKKQVTAQAADKINITLTYNNNGNPAAKAFLDYIEIIGKKQLEAKGKQFSFRNFGAVNNSGIIAYQIANKSNIFQVWDVTNSLNPKIITNQSKGINFVFNAVGGTLKEYILLSQSDFYTPQIVKKGAIKNQSLQGVKNIEYLIITNEELFSEAQRLADYHQTNSNLTTKTVLVSEINNEFASGGNDIVGIRNFIRNLYKNSSFDKKLKYVCFFGDSSYDFKNRLSGNNNIVPTYHATESFNLVTSYVTDDFFVMIDDTDGGMNLSDTIDIASGRIPVSTPQEAKNVVNKILSYKKSFGDWRNTIVLAADDIDQPADISLQQGLEKVADLITNKKPIFNLKKIYADAYKQEVSSGGERYPDVQKEIANALEKGTLLFNYFGHGGEDGLGDERYIEISQISNFYHPKTLPLFITVTCDFSRFDNPLRISSGEKLFKNPKGGAVSMITTSREIFISTGEMFNKTLVKHVLDFDNTNSSIATSLMKSKNETNDIQKYFIFFFGDPAMKLAIPQPNVLITKLNGVPLSQPVDDLKALSKVKFEGMVTDKNNKILPNFNGVVSATVFDKPIDKQTLDNDNFGVINTFDTQESKLFRGKSSVKNGAFSFEFVVPKDIKIALGKGKISMYANDTKIDKGGANFDITIGGINNKAPKDNKGPEIRPFFNNTSFVDGGNTSTNPNLIIKLYDANGINTSVTAVDHDIVAVLDGNDANPIILNDYYETDLNDFTKGTVTYKFRNLTAGKHRLEIKAWDTYNNSSKATLNFTVVEDNALRLRNVLNYPNPFVNYTEFWFNHNRPNEILDVQVQIFTVSGKLIKTLRKTTETSDNLFRALSWNGLDDFGNKIAKGVYVYKLTVKSLTSNLKNEEYEKLVIL